MKTKQKEKLKEKPKKEKTLFDRFFNRNKLIKTNKVAIVLLQDNALVEFFEVETRDEQFNVNGTKFHTDRDCVYTTKKDRIPLAIIREWDMAPLGTKKWYDTDGIEENDDLLRERFAQLEKHVLRGIKNAELYKYSERGSRGKLTTKQVIVYVIIALVAGAILVGYL